jgi:hypothetical protein
VPAALTAEGIQKAAAVYDFLGRGVASGIPANVTAAALFIVLPAGTVGRVLRVEPPLRAVNSQVSSTTPPDQLLPSSVVLQAAFPYASNALVDDAHTLNATGHATAFYVYNFGAETRHGTLTVKAATSTIVTPLSWPNVVVAPGDRTRLTAYVTPPGGRAAVSGDPSAGGITLSGDFGEGPTVSPPELYARVVVNLETLKPAQEVPCAGATNPVAWVPNIARGGAVNITRGATAECVHFAITFAETTPDPWAYPTLSFNASTAPPGDMDGIRFTVGGVSASASSGGVKQLNALFTDKNGTGYLSPFVGGPVDQEFTMLLRNAEWNNQGPLPPGPLTASSIARVQLGLNLIRGGGTASMNVCNLRWVRF